MSDHQNPPQDHPDELLAGYVDGSATAEQRRVVDAHLDTCSACREDLQLAAEARAALASLPELGAPGLAEAGVLALRRAALQPVPTERPAPAARERAPAASTGEAVPRPTRERRWRLGWTQLAGAAAILVVLGGLVAIPLALSGGGGSKRLSSGAAQPEATPSPIPSLFDRGASYTPATLDALAASVTSFARDANLDVKAAPPAPTMAPAALASGGASTRAATVLAPSDARTAVACLITGGGTPDEAVPFYLEEADVSGKPAYVGAFFLQDAKLNVMLVAVTRDGCQFLYSVRQST